jgi:lipoprotein-anchoring transpeptidase ErfK/SrfK
VFANSFLRGDRNYPDGDEEPLNLSVIFPTGDGRVVIDEGVMSRSVTLAALIGAVALSCGSAKAEPLFAFLAPAAPAQTAPQTVAVAPTDDQDDAPVDARLRRQIVNYSGHEASGTVIIDTPNTFLYYVLGNGKAMRYGIGVGREGFTWSGVKTVERKTEWPDWYPPSEMLARQPYLPRMTAGGQGNPLGARAMYIAGTQYRIHGTNAPSTIGKQVSSGCIRLTNDDVIDLYNRVQVGAKVVVLPQTASPKSRQASMAHAYAPASQSRAQATWDTIRPSGRY